MVAKLGLGPRAPNPGLSPFHLLQVCSEGRRVQVGGGTPFTSQVLFSHGLKTVLYWRWGWGLKLDAATQNYLWGT